VVDQVRRAALRIEGRLKRPAQGRAGGS
jgi:hypothetical protein